MKFLKKLVSIICCISLFGCCDKKDTLFERVKADTGASDTQIEEGIKLYTNTTILIGDKLEAGTLKAEEMLELAKSAKDVMATVQRDDEMAAAVTFAYLRALDQQDTEKAREMMVAHLRRFLEADYPSTENSEMIREKILEYEKTSPGLLKKEGEVD